MVKSLEKGYDKCSEYVLLLIFDSIKWSSLGLSIQYWFVEVTLMTLDLKFIILLKSKDGLRNGNKFSVSKHWLR